MCNPRTLHQSAPDALHARFLSILPRIERHGRVYFRAVKCPHTRADRIADMVALSWKWFRNLAHQGKDATRFPSALATYAARAVRNGRRVIGMEKTKDVLSRLTQQRRHFAVSTLPTYEALSTNPFSEALADNTQTPVDEQVCFRCDFPAWLHTLTHRNRRLAEDLMLGERTLDTARKYHISEGRVSQMRRELHRDWLRFQDEGPAEATMSRVGVA